MCYLCYMYYIGIYGQSPLEERIYLWVGFQRLIFQLFYHVLLTGYCDGKMISYIRQ